ncbi:MAG: DUF4886 domain-containing protein [Oscillospiraceae bacterium]|nr:DUF4886 domain-containing protein [Oscillospiraceae bacterium]
MIGSSFCYYYVEELQAMLAADGIKAKVCNVYYSGCPLEKHWTWWKSGEANYDYYVTDENGRVGTKGVNLEYCLTQENWDFISLQESSSRLVKNGGAVHLSNTQLYWQELLDFLMEQFPKSRFGWHQTWTYQVDYGKEGTTMTPQLQEENQTQQEIFSKGVCDHYDGKLMRIPSGRAWQNARTKYGYDYLTCRMKIKSGAGDGYHDGDIGGGQYLNACVWYEIITGKSCLNNTYRPAYKATALLSDELNSKLKVTLNGSDYVLNDELISILQNSAHEAVAELGLNIAD